MPNIAGPWLSTAHSARDGWAKLRNPSADSFARNINPSLKEHLFELAKAEVETTTQPNSVSDDRCWKTMALVTD